jgi:hypothetical protein
MVVSILLKIVKLPYQREVGMLFDDLPAEQQTVSTGTREYS